MSACSSAQSVLHAQNGCANPSRPSLSVLKRCVWVSSAYFERGVRVFQHMRAQQTGVSLCMRSREKEGIQGESCMLASQVGQSLCVRSCILCEGRFEPSGCKRSSEQTGIKAVCFQGKAAGVDTHAELAYQQR